jgi:PAS domain S-box-containing protein
MKGKDKKKILNKPEQEKDIITSIIEDIPVLICRIQQNEKIIFTNKIFCDYLGMAKDQLEGKKISAVFLSKNILKLNEAIKNVKRTGREKTFIITDKANKDKQYQWTVRPICEKTAKISEYQITGIELPKRKLKKENNSAREKFEIALLNSEKRFKELVESTSDWIWELDKNGLYSYSSPKVKEILGYEPYEIIGQSPFDLMSEEEKIRVKAIVDSYMAKKEPFSGIMNINSHKNGEKVFLETSAIPILNNTGELIGYRGIDRDITQNIRTELQIKNANALLSAIFESSPEIIVFALDAEYRYIAFNSKHEEAIETIWGKKIDLGMNMLEIIGNHRDKIKAKENFDRALRGESFWLNEEFGNEKLQRLSWQDYYAPIIADENKIIGLTCFVLNITERKRTEEALRISEEKYRSIIETTNEWIWEINLKGNHTYSNRVVESILGYHPDEIINKNAFSLIHDEDKEKVEKVIQNCIAERKGWHDLVVRWKHKNGSYYYLESNSLPMFDKKGELQGFRGADRNITERKLAEEKIRKNEEQLRELTENMVDLIGRFDPNAVFVYASPSYEKVLGYKPEELIGKSAVDLIHPDEKDQAISAIRSVLKNGNGYVQFRYKHKEGSYRWFESTGRYLFNEEGNPIGSILGSRDITERKKIEIELKESEIKYRKIFESIQDIYYRIDDRDTIVEISPSIKRYTDFDSLQLIGKKAGTIYYYPEERTKLIGLLKEKGEVIDFEIKLRNKFDKPVHASLNAHIIYNNEGKYSGIEGTIRDISERKRIEKELQEKTEELNRFFSLALENFCIANTQGYFLTLNQLWEKTLGFSIEELQGKKFLDYVHPDDLDETIKAVGKLSENTPVLNFTNRYRCKDGSYKWLEWRSFPYEGKLIYAAARDITDRLNYEDQIKKMNNELRELNKNKDKFFSIFAHDLKSPFQALLGMSELIADPEENLSPEEMKEYSVRINIILKNQYALIQNLLDWSRLQLGRASVNKILLKPHELVNSVIILLSGNYQKKNIKILNEIDKNMSIFGDPDMLRSIIQNFISNSIKFTSKNGVIKIKAKYLKGFVQILIEDNGVGISKDGLDKIFKLDEKYTTLGTDGESGSGLGFLLCRDMIEKHGGKLEVESEINKGTVVKFTMPLIKK